MARTLLVGLFAVIMAACGGTPAPTPVPTATPVGTVGPGASFASSVQMLAAVKAASVRLEVTARLREPGAPAMTDAGGTGSGFLIASDGLVVTNYHVVAGASEIDAYVGGGRLPVDASLVAASECADLAVLRLSGTKSWPALRWYTGSIDVGLDVFSAGYPLGDPQFTANRGIVAKLEAHQSTPWAAPERVVQHDAEQHEGNSGSPLVTTDGTVVAVEYAGNDDGQHFAIDRDIAQPIVDQLMRGEAAESIGIYGEAYDQSALSGVWVSHVLTDSAAWATGIRPGDVITHLDSSSTASGGTLTGFCGIVRRQQDDDMRVKVIRLDPATELSGNLDGERLKPTGRTVDLGLDGSYKRFETIKDDDGVLSLEVPVAWPDHDGRHWEGDSGTDYGPSITAAPDIDDFWSAWTTPGIFVSWSDSLGRDYSAKEYVESLSYVRECTPIGSERATSVGGVAGWLYRFEACGVDHDGEMRVFVGLKGGTLLSIEGQLITDADTDAWDRALRTLTVPLG